MMPFSSKNGHARKSGARIAASWFAVLLGTTGLAACSNGGDDTKARPTSAPLSTPATTGAPQPETQARADVLAVYNRAQGYFESAQKNGRIGNENVMDTMTDKARGQWAASGLRYQQQNIRLDGTITRAPKVTVVDLAGSPPTATVADCIDISAAKVVDAKSGVAKKPAEGQSPRYVQTTSLIRDGERWLVADVVPERGRAC